MTFEKTKRGGLEIQFDEEEVIRDYRLAYQSRQASLIGRREVLNGKAKFGIFGDGKEVAQIAMAKAFRKGDFRSGYYRDQTFMFAIGAHNYHEFFAQLYADPELEREPATAGRGMNAHFATRSLDEKGEWRDIALMYNSAADISPTGSQMPRLVGLAYASKLYRELEELKHLTQFSRNGDEVAFGTIGNASCAEGMFWEAINAIAVLQAPAVLSIWDDEYGISVPSEYQLPQDLSTLLSGFQRKEDNEKGFDLYRVKGWDYPGLIDVYQKAAKIARKEHVPAIIHVVDVTQPQGHSTSGSHERYKPKDRIAWEEKFDCNLKLRSWIVENGIATDKDLLAWEQEDKILIEDIRKDAWEKFNEPIGAEIKEFGEIIDEISTTSPYAERLLSIKEKLANSTDPMRENIMSAVREALTTMRSDHNPTKNILIEWKHKQEKQNLSRYGSNLYSNSRHAAENILEVKAEYSDGSERLNGYEILNRCFDAMMSRDPRVIAFGEDLGLLGGVNQGFAGLQEKYGVLRVSDVGIRETTIVGQAIGMALRGLRPIAELQYLDYVLYALQIMSDDLASLHWRTKGGQKAPVIIRTRGHRLEGIWHSGSPMAGLIHVLRGMHVLVPRNMVQAAGFYNTLLLSDEPGMVVEVLNGYRLKEVLPDNIGEFTIPLGVPEVLREGSDLTIVTYGPLCRIAMETAGLLSDLDIEVEIVDVQSLLPFDINETIVESLKKTNRIIFLDEDVPGGATAYMMQEVIEKQGGYYWLDSEPRTLTAKPHRPAYGSDGNYWSKPNVDQIFEAAYDLMNEVDPGKYPVFY